MNNVDIPFCELFLVYGYLVPCQPDPFDRAFRKVKYG